MSTARVGIAMALTDWGHLQNWRRLREKQADKQNLQV